MQLPPPLQPWAEHLSLFTDESAAAYLGEIVRRLALAVGPLREAVTAGRTEPDGYSGLERRGNYERLLISEWLMAEEAPEEFDRRAAVGEHLFLRPRRMEPQSSARSVLLLDCGPMMLGKPRVVLLAAVILMARRAESAGAQFHWGIQQFPEDGLHEAVSEETILDFLGKRSLVFDDEDHLSAWKKQLRPSSGESLDLWCAGTSVSALTELKAKHLLIREMFEPNEQALLVSVFRERDRRDLELEMPEEDVAIRLLRHPFQRRIRKRTVTALPHCGTEIFFSSNGRRFAFVSGQQVISYAIPNSVSQEPSSQKVFDIPPGNHLAGVQIHKKATRALTISEGRLFFHRMPNCADPASSAIPEDMNLQGGSRNIYYLPGPLLEDYLDYSNKVPALQHDMKRHHLLLLDDNRTLWRVAWGA